MFQNNRLDPENTSEERTEWQIRREAWLLNYQSPRVPSAKAGLMGDSYADAARSYAMKVVGIAFVVGVVLMTILCMAMIR